MTGVDTHHVSDVSMYCCNKLPDLGNLKAHWRLGLWQPTYSDNGWNVQLSIRNTFIIGKHHHNIEQTLKKRNEIRQETSGRFARGLRRYEPEACSTDYMASGSLYRARIGTYRHVTCWRRVEVLKHHTVIPSSSIQRRAGDGRWCWYEWPLGAGPFSVACQKKQLSELIGQQMFVINLEAAYWFILIQTDS